MKTIRLLFFLSLLAFAFSCKKDDAALKTADSASGPDIVYHVSKSVLLQIVNDTRKSGCTCGTTQMPPVSAVAWNDELASAADAHSQDMLANNYFSHTGSDNSDPGDRIEAAGYSWQAYGENIALGYPDEQAVMTGWLHSEDHCKNIMNSNFKDMGVAREGNYWTQDFGEKK